MSSTICNKSVSLIQDVLEGKLEKGEKGIAMETKGLRQESLSMFQIILKCYSNFLMALCSIKHWKVFLKLLSKAVKAVTTT